MTEHGEVHRPFRPGRVRVLAWSLAALALLAPLVAMQFTGEVAWTAGDFAFAGALLLTVGLGFEAALRAQRGPAFRVAAGLALGGAFVLLWANGAVGIIGNEGNAVNLAFYGVLAVGIVGAVLARFRAGGLAWAMTAMALAHALVAAGALFAGQQHGTGSPVGEIVVVNGGFVAVFAASAWLFRRAARGR